MAESAESDLHRRLSARRPSTSDFTRLTEKPLTPGQQRNLSAAESLVAQITFLIDFETNPHQVLVAFDLVFSQVLSVFESTKPLILLRNFA
ncbi:hypothetical protein [Rhizobium sp. CIAT894]|uniref:hypothetical protein n=1 Tax=Rhizobium sp. CIAT894 TaxID=2020312 RepID=UPI000F73F789|nr:hypothetical protein [Rhizobium sp. CIAT894]